MARKKKMTTYVDEDLLRSAKILAARRDSKIYEVFEEALRRYLTEEVAQQPELSLAEALSTPQSAQQPGVPSERAVRLPEGQTLSEAVLAERQSCPY